VQIINAQDSIPKINNQEKIDSLKTFKETIKNQERDFLKAEVEAINLRVDNGEITNEEATVLKKESAKKRALNIENRISIVNNKISLYERNIYETDYELDKENKIGIMISNKTFNIKGTKKEPKYDLRTSNDFLFAIGFNNVIIDGENFDDSPYKKGGSGFVELGWNWKTRVFKNSEFLRFKYGVSLQWNKLNPKDNQYFVQNGNATTLEEFSTGLKKSEFRVTNLVLPVHFEFGPLKKLDRTDRIRYINNNQFKIGLGGYAGFNIGTQQKLKYNENGNNIKEKIRRDFNTNDFVYGLSGYIGFGDTALYVKYDLSPIFKSQLIEQNNISVGIRFDVD
tara:strand:+ start:70253 stop:71266 length:1014 start_codon:yes stop_codon:yes gene_type:complete